MEKITKQTLIVCNLIVHGIIFTKDILVTNLRFVFFFQEINNSN